jgi:AcrR family transcriptional regulator
MPRRARTNQRRQPVQQRAEDTVAVLLDATERVLEAQGFHGATTNHIARTAGVSIGTLYHYFPTKEALVAGVVHRLWAAELETLATRAHLFAELPLEDAIREACRALCAYVWSRVDLYRTWYSEASHLGELDRGLDMSGNAASLVKGALELHAARLRPGLDVAFASDFIVKTALALARTGARDYPGELESGKLADELALMLSRYLLA